jgi:hypothetical protein
MGEVLEAYFEKVKAKGGLVAQVKLAMITKMSLQKAKQAPDSPDNIALFEEALSKI